MQKSLRERTYLLGIETTAHTFGASIIAIDETKRKHKKEKKSKAYLPLSRSAIKILSNIKESYTSQKEGMIPAQVADHHVKVIGNVIHRALAEAKISFKDLTAIAVSHAPGIGHTLRIGVFGARYLGLHYSLPVIPVNHCIAHLEIGRILTKAKDPVLLYVSGANTQIIAYEAGKYRIFGETLDMGVGNFLDSFGRLLKLGFPAGPKIEELATKGKHYIPLPYTVKGMDFSLGGLLTNLKQKIVSHQYTKEDLCYSTQETVFAMLLEVTERAMAHTGKKEVLLGGGVACNKQLQKMATIMAKERGAKIYILPNEYNVDNAAMIAVTGALMWYAASHHQKKQWKPEAIIIAPYQRTDEVKIFWR